MVQLPKTQASSRSFSINNLITDPFALATISVSLLSWIIAFAGSIASSDSKFPKFTWWGLVYQLILLIMMFLFYCYNIVDYYKTFLAVGTGIAFIYTTNSATGLVYQSGANKAAASAGVILLSMINLIWVFYFASDNASPTNEWIDSFSLAGPRRSALANSEFETRKISSNTNNGANNRFPSYNQASNFNETQTSRPLNATQLSSSRLNGLENLSARENATTNNTNTFNSENTGFPQAGESTNFTIDDFPYRARALYSYDSNPEDENEISFEKDEILQVNDIHSRWWQAKRANGEMGICPSNYVELID
ncbi:hypothetical protein WICPIJ_008925 [Wickerhamomyces pijperi]|uniref:High osmolarity signaling protein SHO1 n=1 Tax=Wickerhamomyces pijperi TaxID=599730 RepID=A0A9P8PTN5_WICPI|nr:hypothetical protein WICPIJ_008925 [Wickerhamomyces pijperi]